MKRLLASIIAILILYNSSCMAVPMLSKDETVYVNLNADGEVSEINIYNKCAMNNATEIIDYTNFISINNLSNQVEYEKSGDYIIWNVSGEDNFAYTGKVSENYYNKLPWNFKITYKLNGAEKNFDELIGCSGLVEIIMDIQANDDSNEYYKNNYILELTGSYDMNKYLSLESDEAMITTTGSTKTLMFIALPGQSTTLDIKIGCNDFSMDGLTMAITPLTGNILDKVTDLVESKKDLENVLDKVDNSTDIILNSLGNMNSGIKGISEGVKEIKSGAIKVHNLDNLRDTDIQNLKNIIEEINPILENIKNNLTSIEESYNDLMQDIQNSNEILKVLSKDIDSLNDSLDNLNDMCESLPEDTETVKNTLSTLSKMAGNLKTLLASIDGGSSSSSDITSDLLSVQSNLKDMGTSLAIIGSSTTDLTILSEVMSMQSAMNSIGENLTDLKNVLESMSSGGGSTNALSKNLTELKNQLNDLSKILSEDDTEVIENVVHDFSKTSLTIEKMLNSIVNDTENLLTDKEKINNCFNDLYNVVDELNKTNVILDSTIQNLQTILDVISNDMYNGAIKTSDSIVSVNSQLSNISSQSSNFKTSKSEAKNIIEDKWNEVENKTNLFNMEKDAKVISFGDERNENVNSVQFILKTPDLKEVKSNANDMEKEKEKLSFGERLSIIFEKLFGWLKKLITAIFHQRIRE